MNKKVFIFRGSPASGKGTITKEFMSTIDGRLAYLELDKFRWGFHLGHRKILDITEDEHEFAYKNYLSILENYLKNGTYTIVTEGLFSCVKSGPHGSMKDILELCEKYNYEYHAFLLCADYEILWDRNLKREYSVPEDEFKMLYDYVMEGEMNNEIKIDVGNNSVEGSVKKIREFI